MVRKLLPVFLLLIAWILPAYGLENVTGKVKVAYGSPVFDSQTQKYYLDVTLQNVSKKDVLEFPLRLLVTSLSQSKASVYQPDGINEDKMPYYLFFQSDKKSLAPGESVGSRKIFFSDVKSGKLNFTQIVQISTTENTMNDFISGLDLINPDMVLKEFDQHAREVYGQVLMSKTYEWPTLANMLRNKTFIPITDVMGKYEIRVSNAGTEEVFLIYLYKNSKGEWKIFMM